jgi:hypothetical protein
MKEGTKIMMALKLSRKPLLQNPSCAYCGKIFNKNVVSLQLAVDHKVIDFPICQPCFEMVPLFEATVNLEQGFARVKR